MKGKLGLLAMTAMLMGAGSAENSNSLRPEDVDTTPKEPPIPKGCKEYFFNQSGGFSTERMRCDECVFKCVASNDKVAKRKFSRYLLNNQTPQP